MRKLEKLRKEYKSLLNGIVAECDYNISIIDEILDGVTKARGSFKRLSIEYLKSVREKSAAYFFPNKLLSAISRLIVDMELFNFEADYCFNGVGDLNVYSGSFDERPICIAQKAVARNILETITKAHEGVLASLNVLKECAQALIEGKELGNE